MAYTEKQAESKARQIFDRFGQLIHAACEGNGVADSFLAGFTGVEAGIDREGQIRPDATRFEPGVYQDLISLRDNGYCWIGGKKHKDYSGVTQAQISDAGDEAIHALATSYGCSQIMGWHVINNLKCTIADLRDVNKHFGYTVQLLKIVGGTYLHRGDLTAVLHIWNTGSANGKTYHEDYVANALKVKKHYEAIMAAQANDFTSSAAEQPAEKPLPDPASNKETERPSPAPPPPDQAPPPSDFVAETKTADAPAADGSTKAATRMTIAGIVLPSFVVVIIQTVQDLIAKGYVDAKDIGSAAIDLIRSNQKYAFGLIGVFLGYLILRKAFKQVTLWIEMFIKAVPHWHDVEVKKQ